MKVFLNALFMLKTFYFVISTGSTSGSNSYQQENTFDSLMNLYKENQFSHHFYKDIYNSTWKEFTIAEELPNLIKMVPAYIDSDEEVDLFILDNDSKLNWISNIRGTSKIIKKHEVSKFKITDFVISQRQNFHNKDKDYYILGINSKKEKVLKFQMTSYDFNDTYVWSQETLYDIKDESLVMNELIKDYVITSINLNVVDKNTQYLYLSVENVYDYSCYFIKMTIDKGKIDYRALISVNKKRVKIVGTYDMNKDGLIDVLFMDELSNLHVLVNNDPDYYPVLISTVNTVKIKNSYRLFVVDVDRDSFPDVVASDSIANTVGILFNPGRKFWNELKKNKEKSKTTSDQVWKFIPIIDVINDNLSDIAIKDFTLYLVKKSKRINFELFVIYENKLHWYIEKDLNLTIDYSHWGRNKIEGNYLHCMERCDIVVEDDYLSKDLKTYDFVTEVDVNEDSLVELMVYSNTKSALYWMQQYEPFVTGFGWNSKFWIYIIIYIYIASSIVGIYEFYKLKRLNDRYAKEKNLLKDEGGNASNSDNQIELKI